MISSNTPPDSHPLYLGPLLCCHPICSPMLLLHCLPLEKPAPDDGEIWVWSHRDSEGCLPCLGSHLSHAC